MFSNVAYRATVYKTGSVTAMETETSKLVLTAKIFFFNPFKPGPL